jgi:pimeloyl-ACP methyl ester carboxylesterase
MDGWTLSREYGSAQGAVRYEVFGTGPPVVLVHGTPFSSHLWRRVVPALAQTNTVYAFDLPGYGSSEKREGQDVSLAAQGRVHREARHQPVKLPLYIQTLSARGQHPEVGT